MFRVPRQSDDKKDNSGEQPPKATPGDSSHDQWLTDMLSALGTSEAPPNTPTSPLSPGSEQSLYSPPPPSPASTSYSSPPSSSEEIPASPPDDHASYATPRGLQARFQELSVKLRTLAYKKSQLVSPADQAEFGAIESQISAQFQHVNELFEASQVQPIDRGILAQAITVTESSMNRADTIFQRAVQQAQSAPKQSLLDQLRRCYQEIVLQQKTLTFKRSKLSLPGDCAEFDSAVQQMTPSLARARALDDMSYTQAVDLQDFQSIIEALTASMQRIDAIYYKAIQRGQQTSQELRRYQEQLQLLERRFGEITLKHKTLDVKRAQLILHSDFQEFDEARSHIELKFVQAQKQLQMARMGNADLADFETIITVLEGLMNNVDTIYRRAIQSGRQFQPRR